MSDVTGVELPAQLNAFALLRMQHVRLAGAARRLLRWEPPHNSAHLQVRWGRLQAETLRRHERLEDEHFWPVVRRVVPDGERLAGLAEEQQEALARSLGCMDRPGADPSPVRRVGTLILGHLAFEEERVWPVLWESLGVAEARDLSDAIRGAGPV